MSDEHQLQDHHQPNADEGSPPDTTPSETPVADDAAAPASDAPAFAFAHRLYSLPLVHDAVTNVCAAAQDPNTRYARLANPLAGYTAALLNKAQDLSEPYLARLQGPITTVDSLGCRSLDLLETRFPLIAKPTDEVLETGKQTYQACMDTVTRPFTDATARASTRAVGLVDRADAVVDAWLPDTVSQSEGTTAQPEAGETGQEDCESGATPPSPVQRAREVGQKVRTRVTRRLSTHLPPGAEPLLTHPVQYVSGLLQDSRRNLTLANAKLHESVLNLRTYAQHTRESTTEYLHSDAKAEQAQATLRSLSERLLGELERVSVQLQAQVPRLPEPAQAPVQSVIDYTAERYVRIKAEMGRTDVPAAERASNVLKITTAGLPVVDRVVTVLLNYTSNPGSPARTPTPGSPSRPSYADVAAEPPVKVA